MQGQKYAKNIVTETKPFPKEVMERLQARRKETGSSMESTRLLWLDDEIVKGAYYMEFLWLWRGSSNGFIEEPHQHDFAELIGFIGTNQQDPSDLGGEIDIWLGDERHTLTKSCLVFVPKELKHCPIQFNRIDKPILWFTAAPIGMYKKGSITPATNNTNTPAFYPSASQPSVDTATSKYGKYIITQMKSNLSFPRPPRNIPPDASKMTRILWLDDEVAKGAFYMECVWFGEGSGAGGPEPHTHDFDEVLGFIGTNSQEPRDLGAEVELWLDDEKYILRNSCLVFIPRGVKHCPMIFRKVKKPVFHFSSGNGGMYLKVPSK